MNSCLQLHSSLQGTSEEVKSHVPCSIVVQLSCDCNSARRVRTVDEWSGTFMEGGSPTYNEVFSLSDVSCVLFKTHVRGFGKKTGKLGPEVSVQREICCL